MMKKSNRIAAISVCAAFLFAMASLVGTAQAQQDEPSVAQPAPAPPIPTLQSPAWRFSPSAFQLGFAQSAADDEREIRRSFQETMIERERATRRQQEAVMQLERAVRIKQEGFLGRVNVLRTRQVGLHGATFSQEDREFLGEELPGSLKLLEELEAEDSDWNRTRKTEVGMRIRVMIQELKRIAKDDAASYESQKMIFRFDVQGLSLDIRSEDLAVAIRKTKAKDEREDLIKTLKKVLDDAFNAHEQHREYKARMIEAELEEIRSLLDRRKKNRRLILERRLALLTGQSDELEW